MRDDVQDKDRLPVLQELVNDYITQKQSVLLQVKKGQMSREDFMEEVKHHVEHYYELSRAQSRLCWTSLNSMCLAIPFCRP